MVGENIFDVFLAVPTVVGENILDVCILEKMTNHFLRPPYKRPEILADRIPIRENPGTFVRRSQKVVGHFFERGLGFERVFGFEKGTWIRKRTWIRLYRFF